MDSHVVPQPVSWLPDRCSTSPSRTAWVPWKNEASLPGHSGEDRAGVTPASRHCRTYRVVVHDPSPERATVSAGPSVHWPQRQISADSFSAPDLGEAPWVCHAAMFDNTASRLWQARPPSAMPRVTGTPPPAREPCVGQTPADRRPCLTQSVADLEVLVIGLGPAWWPRLTGDPYPRAVPQPDPLPGHVVPRRRVGSA